jgi:hypothetical protein
MNRKFKNAKNLRELNATQIIKRDQIGGGNRDDFYRFKVISSSNVTFDLSKLKREASLKLLNPKGQTLATSNQVDRLSEQVGGTLQAGNYVLQIQGQRTTPYTLKASATPAAPLPNSPPFVPNPGGRMGLTQASAIDLGNPVGGLALSAVGPGNQNVYYKFNAAENSNLTAAYSSSRSPFEFELFRDANNNGAIEGGEAAQSVKAGSLSNGLSAAIPDGTYYLKLGISSSSNFAPIPFQLNLSVTPIPSNLPTDPGNDVTQALDLGELQTGTRSLSSYLGEMDETDWYRFMVGQPKTVQFTYINNTSAGDSRLAYTGLFLDSNSNGLVDSGETIRNPDSSSSLGDFSKTLQPGTYFMRLKREQQSNYSLNVTTP